MMKGLLVSVMLLWAVACPDRMALAADAPAAPFGLTWGMSSDAARTLGVDLSSRTDSDFGVQYTATKLPSVLSDIDLVYLFFDYKDRLWRVFAASRSFENDPYGASVQSRYDELDQVLASKYGVGSHHHYQDQEMWKEPSEFLAGISDGRSWHYTDYRSGPVTVQLGIRALSFDVGVYTLIFKNEDLSKEFDQQKKEREKGAL
jgi:hypothetical protein